MSKTRRAPGVKHRKAPVAPALVAFICPECKLPYGDPLYHGPFGHAPPGLCFDCWVRKWDEWEELMVSWSPKWKRLDVALWLTCHGDTYGDAADALGVHVQTVRRWIREMRTGKIPVPAWLVNLREQAAAKL